MEKYIHYCWFGGKKLPKLARKCIKSWKKYLPDYKIIEWNEKNFDVNMTKFSKQAYKAKKWAFVSDVARVYALKNFGGIYFDTDMIVKKNIDFLLNNEVFAGWESEYNVAVGILGVKNKNNELINKLWNFYCENEFSVENVYSLSIPTILTNILKREYGLVSNHLENQLLVNDVMIYARDYFYPISSDKNEENLFSNNTCTVHFYVGSWLSDVDKQRLKFQMIFGKNLGNTILNFLVLIKRVVRKILKLVFYPILVYKKKKNKEKFYQNLRKKFVNSCKGLSSSKYIVFYNYNWLGTKNATTEVFENTIGIEELWDDRLIEDIKNWIIRTNKKMVIFSAFSFGWDKLIEKIKKENPSIIIKVIWHGSNALNVEPYDWACFEKIFKLLDRKIIDSIAFVKKSMYEYYKLKNYNVEFLVNTVHLDSNVKKNTKYIDDGFVKIGIYSSGDRWVKNSYNQLAAASLFEKNKIDCVPTSEKALKMAKICKTTISGLSSSISRSKLLERMSKNDINFYVTFSECSPMIPLESLELGVPCLTSNNHHYWEGTELEKYLIVNENDNIIKIYEKAKYCLENKEKVLKLYKEWKKNYDLISKKSVEKFLYIKGKNKGEK